MWRVLTLSERTVNINNHFNRTFTIILYEFQNQIPFTFTNKSERWHKNLVLTNPVGEQLKGKIVMFVEQSIFCGYPLCNNYGIIFEEKKYFSKFVLIFDGR